MNRTKPIFPVLILNARPAAGKSEIMAYLQSLDEEDRRNRFHLGNIVEIDDFPMLWTWFEEDAILSEMGFERLHTDANGYFVHHGLWNLLIRRISFDYEKLLTNNPKIHSDTTVLIEFSRGSEHGGYRDAYHHLSDQLLEVSSVLYLDVTYEESLRKNRKRFNPEKPYSILEHGLSDEKMATLYRDTDWAGFSRSDPNFLTVGKKRVPYAVLDNSDDVTTKGGDALGHRIEQALNSLPTPGEDKPV